MFSFTRRIKQFQKLGLFFLVSVLIFLSFPLNTHAQIAGGPLVINLTNGNSYTTNDGINFTTTGALVNHCFAYFLTKDGSVVPGGSDPGRSCRIDQTIGDDVFFQNDTAYSWGTVLSTNNYGIPPLEAGSYSLRGNLYEPHCSIDVGGQRQGCSWRQIKTSVTVPFTVTESDTPATYTQTLSISPSSGRATDTFTANINLRRSDNDEPVSSANVDLSVTNFGDRSLGSGTTDENGNISLNISDRVIDMPAGSYTVRARSIVSGETINATTSFRVTEDRHGGTGGGPGGQPRTPLDANCTPTEINAGTCTTSIGKVCRVSDGAILESNDTSADGVMTSLGCIPTQPASLIQGLIRFATGIGGAIALLLMIIGSFRIILSKGDPEAIKQGQQQFTAAFIGLLFIIFAVVLLRIIGVDLLDLPGFG